MFGMLMTQSQSVSPQKERRLCPRPFFSVVVVVQGLYPKGKDVGLRSRGKGFVRISRCVGRKG